MTEQTTDPSAATETMATPRSVWNFLTRGKRRRVTPGAFILAIWVIGAVMDGETSPANGTPVPETSEAIADDPVQVTMTGPSQVDEEATP